VHPYFGASAGCWRIFGDVLAKEYSDFHYGKVHRLTVDAYAVQHPGKAERRAIQSVNVHLVALCLTLESNVPYEQATKALSELAKGAKTGKVSFDWLARPKDLGKLTVLDVHAAVDANDHCRRVRDWAECAWQAWGQHHDAIRSLIKTSLPG
jgi:hypothetical protein